MSITETARMSWDAGHHAIADLCAELGAGCLRVVDGSVTATALHRAGAGPLVVILDGQTGARTLTDVQARILASLDNGFPTLLAVAPTAADALRLLAPEILEGTSPLTQLDPDDPLIDSVELPGVSWTGQPADVVDSVALFGGGDELVTVTGGQHSGAVVAMAMTRGTTRITVFGSTRMLDDQHLVAPGNAAAVAFALGASVSAATHAATRLSRLVPRLGECSASPTTVVLTDGQAVELTAIVNHEIRSRDTIEIDGPEFMSAAWRLGRHLPESVWEALGEFADMAPAAGALCLKGLPVGELPATPADPNTPIRKDHVSELVLLGVARLLGQPVGYLPEHGGRLVQNLCPTPSSASRQTSTSSAVALMFHTEAAFHRHRPRYLALLCLRGDQSAETTLASVDTVVQGLSLGTRKLLFEPRFRMGADESYAAGRSTRLGRCQPVLRGDPTRPIMVADVDLMVGVDAPSRHALDELNHAVETAHTSIVLEAGDLLVIDNDRAVHGRSRFTPRYDGTDRWLQRTFVVSDLNPSAAERTGRVITTRFGS